MNVILPNVMLVAGILAFIFVIYAGFMTITYAGRGDAEGASKWKKALGAAIIGLLLIFTAYWIVEIIGFVTGAQVKFL
jgi:hypothetical protein